MSSCGNHIDIWLINLTDDFNLAQFHEHLRCIYHKMKNANIKIFHFTEWFANLNICDLKPQY